MRFMMIVKHRENQGPPPKELMDAIAKSAEEEVKTGRMLGNGGLGATSLGGRVPVSRGAVTRTDGHFTEATEGIGGYAPAALQTRGEANQNAGASLLLLPQSTA